MNLDVKVAKVVLVRHGVDARYAGQKRSAGGRLSHGVHKSHGSAINRSVSLMILFGSAAMFGVMRSYAVVVLDVRRGRRFESEADFHVAAV